MGGNVRHTTLPSISALTALFGPDTPSPTQREREGDRNRKLTGRFPRLWSPPAEFDQNGATLSAFPTMETSREHSRDKRGTVWYLMCTHITYPDVSTTSLAAIENEKKINLPLHPVSNLFSSFPLLPLQPIGPFPTSNHSFLFSSSASPVLCLLVFNIHRFWSVVKKKSPDTLVNLSIWIVICIYTYGEINLMCREAEKQNRSKTETPTEMAPLTLSKTANTTRAVAPQETSVAATASVVPEQKSNAQHLRMEKLFVLLSWLTSVSLIG